MNNMSISETLERLDDLESYACGRARELPEGEKAAFQIIGGHLQGMRNARMTLLDSHYALHECRVCHRQLPLNHNKRGWQIDADDLWICPGCNPR